VAVGDSTLSFVLEHNLSSGKDKESFYNFYRRNNRWEEVQLKDILHLQLEKRVQLNDLITQKIKVLKNAQIDCSNPTDFIGQVETRFMLTKEGIDFCFKSAQNSTEMVVVSCAWADLLLFLKKY
jgi:hypothetical protein